MFSKKALLFLAVMVLLGLVAAQCGAQPEPQTVVQTVIVTQEVQGETVEVVKTVEVEKEVVKEVMVQPEDPDAGKVKVNTVIGTEPPSLDPALATDSTSIFMIRQMFVGLAGKAGYQESAPGWSETGLTAQLQPL